MSKEFREILDDHAVARARLLELMKLQPMTYNELAKEIGITPATVKGFVMDTKVTDLKRLTQIRNYIEKREQEIVDLIKSEKDKK